MRIFAIFQKTSILDISIDHHKPRVFVFVLMTSWIRNAILIPEFWHCKIYAWLIVCTLPVTTQPSLRVASTIRWQSAVTFTGGVWQHCGQFWQYFAQACGGAVWLWVYSPREAKQAIFWHWLAWSVRFRTRKVTVICGGDPCVSATCVWRRVRVVYYVWLSRAEPWCFQECISYCGGRDYFQ